jgi:hypothetical protein
MSGVLQRAHTSALFNQPRRRPRRMHREFLMKTINRHMLVSLLWLFTLLNFIYCDVIGLHDPVELNSLIGGHAGQLEITAPFLLASSILMEIPISMVLVARVASRQVARITSIAAASFMVLVQSASLFVGTPAPSYVFFSIIEIASLVLIGVIAIRWTAARTAVAAETRIAA